MSVRPFRLKAAAGVLGAGVLLTACGGSPTSSASPAAAAGAATGIDAVYKAVSGKTGQDRYDTLLKLAKDAGGSCGYYHAGDQKVDVAAFQTKTGLKIDDFQATSERVAERVLNESKANQQGSSVVLGSAGDIVPLQKEGGIAHLDSPVTNDVTADFKGTDWVSPIAIMEMPTYNTNAVKAGTAPRTWEDFFSTYKGRKAIELTDWDWFATIVQNYFVKQKGMTEDAAIALVTNGLRGASTVDGHTLVTNLLASGQYDYVPNAFAHYVPGLVKKGAPISYEGLSPDMPPMTTTLAMGVTAGAKNPACGLLFLEWSMSEEGQNVVASKDYLPPSSTYKGTSLLKQYPNALSDDIAVTGTPEEKKAWQDKFDVMLRAAGTKATK